MAEQKQDIANLNISYYADKFLKSTIKQTILKKLNDGTISHRFKSWEYCRMAFLKVKDKAFSSLTQEELDGLSLQLSFYLASWGMYRGSSFLLGYDYKIHSGVIELLFKYKQLFTLNPFLANEQNEYLEAIFGNAQHPGIYKEIEDYYNPFRIAFFKSVNKKPKSKSVSDILITKILMGVYGCIPAFDRFFKTGLSTINGMQQKFSKGGVEKLLNIISTRYNEFNRYCKNFEAKRKQVDKQNTENIYTAMKIVDSVFWQIGLDKKNEMANNAEIV